MRGRKRAKKSGVPKAKVVDNFKRVPLLDIHKLPNCKQALEDYLAGCPPRCVDLRFGRSPDDRRDAFTVSVYQLDYEFAAMLARNCNMRFDMHSNAAFRPNSRPSFEFSILVTGTVQIPDFPGVTNYYRSCMLPFPMRNPYLSSLITIPAEEVTLINAFFANPHTDLLNYGRNIRSVLDNERISHHNEVFSRIKYPGISHTTANMCDYTLVKNEIMKWTTLLCHPVHQGRLAEWRGKRECPANPRTPKTKGLKLLVEMVTELPNELLEELAKAIVAQKAGFDSHYSPPGALGAVHSRFEFDFDFHYLKVKK